MSEITIFHSMAVQTDTIRKVELDPHIPNGNYQGFYSGYAVKFGHNLDDDEWWEINTVNGVRGKVAVRVTVLSGKIIDIIMKEDHT